jgi:hypothetical protein
VTMHAGGPAAGTSSRVPAPRGVLASKGLLGKCGAFPSRCFSELSFYLENLLLWRIGFRYDTYDADTWPERFTRPEETTLHTGWLIVRVRLH